MTCIELFAGGGGAALGLHRAGLHTLARCEWDKDACATLRAAAEAGFLDAADVIEGDIRTVDWSPYVGKVDVLWASPPCQAWSSAGKRLGASDDRNGWPWTWDAADAVRPTWLLAENVTGLLMHRGDCDGSGSPDDCPACYFHRRVLPEAERRFASVQWAVLNSSSYGVPQHRRRVYLVCGPRPIRWPVATHGDPAEIRQGGMFAAPLLPWRTVRQALNLDVALRPERGQGMQERHGAVRDHPPTEPAPTIGAGSGGSGPRLQVVAAQPHTITRSRNGRARIEYALADPKLSRGPSDNVRRHPVESDDAPASTVGSLRPTFLLEREDPSRGWEPTDVDAPSPSPRAQRPGGGLRLNGPATRPELLDSPSPSVLARESHGTTVTPTTGERRASDVQCASDVLFLGAGIRRLTVTECALLMSWPADYPLQGTKTSRYRIVGNGCTPPVVELLARAVVAAAGS